MIFGTFVVNCTQPINRIYLSILCRGRTGICKRCLLLLALDSCSLQPAFACKDLLKSNNFSEEDQRTRSNTCVGQLHLHRARIF